MHFNRILATLCAHCAPWITVLLWFQMVALVAAEILPEVTCEVTALGEGLFLHTLSEAFGPETGPEWEDFSHTALTQGPNLDLVRVHNRTDRSLLVKTCLDTRFTATRLNGQRVKAECTFDCRSVTVTRPTPGNSTAVIPAAGICFGEHCVDPMVVWLPLLAVVVVLVGYLAYRKMKKRYTNYRLAQIVGSEREEPPLGLKELTVINA